VLIVLVGALLGLTYNFWGLESNPAYGIAWIGEQRVLGSLEDLIAASSAEGQESTAASPGPGSEIPESDEPLQIQIAGVKRLFDASAALILDAREAEEFEAGHIAGAVNLPFSEMTPDVVEGIDPGGRPIITYCDGSCEVSMDLAWELVLQAGHRRVLVFMGGFPEWEAAGYPVGTGSGGGSTAVAEADDASFTTYIDDPMAFFGSDDSGGEPALPEIPEIDRPLSTELDTVKQFFDAKAAVLLDTREAEEYVEGHIPGALSYPYDLVGDDPRQLDRLDPGDRPIIAYCGGGTCEISMGVADALIARGHRKVLVFMGGFPAWEAAGYPVARGEGPY
jgi:rhodanese-related sulfurtransferase